MRKRGTTRHLFPVVSALKIALFLTALVLSAEAQDAVVLTDGSKLEGGAVSANSTMVTFVSLAGAINVPWTNISNIQLHRKTLITNDRKQTAIPDGALTVAPGGLSFDLDPAHRTSEAYRRSCLSGPMPRPGEAPHLHQSGVLGSQATIPG